MNKKIIKINLKNVHKHEIQELKKYLEANCCDWAEVTSCNPSGWPEGRPWTGKEAAEASRAAGLGLSRSDFSDDGADLDELKEIIEGGN